MWDTVFTRSGGGTAPGKAYLILAMCLSLSACLFDGGKDARLSLAPPPPAFTPTDDVSDRAPDGITIKLSASTMLAENQALAALTTDPPIPEGCSVKDRFDRSSFLSFGSENGSGRLALNLDAGGMNLNGVQLRYTLKLHSGKTKTGKERCLYPGKTQGLLPSVYRELVKRKSDTVWQHLKAFKADLIE